MATRLQDEGIHQGRLRLRQQTQCKRGNRDEKSSHRAAPLRNRTKNQGGNLTDLRLPDCDNFYAKSRHNKITLAARQPPVEAILPPRRAQMRARSQPWALRSASNLLLTRTTLPWAGSSSWVMTGMRRRSWA